MAAPTPPSGGRGVRRTQAPSRLTYEALGNPSDFHCHSYGYQAGAHGYQAAVGNGYQAAVGSGYQEGGGNAQTHLFEESHDGGQNGDAPHSQVGGAHGDGPTGSHVGRVPTGSHVGRVPTGYQAGGNGCQAGGNGYQAGGNGYQAEGNEYQGTNAEMPLFGEPQDGGHDGGGPAGSQVRGANGGGPTGSQVGGANGGGPTGSQLGVAQMGRSAGNQKAKTVLTTTSSTSIRLKKNSLDAKKKIAELEEKLDEKRDELVKAVAELNEAEQIVKICKNKTDTSSTNHVADMQLKMIKLQTTVELLKNEVTKLEKSTARKLNIIEEEKALNEELIVEEDDSNHSSLEPVDKKRNIEDWIKNQQFQNNNFDDFSAHPIPPASPATDNAVVTQLVTALGQAFGNGNRQSVITKQVDKELPIFTGKPEDWLTFISEYERTSQKYHYDDSENVIRLRKFLKGPAKDCINHLLANPANVNKILFTLKQRFGNPQFVLSSLVEKAKGVKSPDVNKPETIVEFGTAVDVLVTNVIAFQMNDYLNNVQLLTELTEKLPAVLRRDWYRWIQSANRKENLEAFSIWLSQEVSTAIRSVKLFPEDDKRNERGKRQHGFNAANEKTDENCACCGKGKHSISICYSFKRLKCEDRWKLVRDNKLCFQCLGKGHLSSSCQNAKFCEMDGCDKYHHRLLHRQKSEKQPPEVKDETTKHTANMAGQVSRPLMYVKVSGPLGTRKVLALLDSGCSFTAVEEEVAVQLGLEVKRSDFTFQVFKGKKETEEKCGNTMLTIEGIRRNAQQFRLQDVKTMEKLGISGNPMNIDDLIKRYPYIRHGKATSIPECPPQMVIGFDNYRLFHSRRTVEGPKLEDPSAHQCRLGWYICTGDSSTECFYACEACSVENDNELHRQIKDFFAVETTGVKAVTPSRSREDMRAMELLEKNTKQTNGRWETCLLWKDDDAMLPESKNMALRRLQLMEKKMDKNPEFAALVNQKFTDYIEKGYLVPANKYKEVKPSPRKWYLPWFFAYHPTKKPRLVYDAAAKSNGKCLNDFLLKGPDLLNPLPAVLMRFREKKIALTGDIKEMFHQVKLRKEDWPSQTVLFRGSDRGSEPAEFYMTVLFFGAASSPCSAIYAKNKNAEIFRLKYPAAVEAIHNNFYMDDYLGTTSTEEEAIQLREQITAIHAAGGFQITKWNSNSTRVLQTIPAELRAEQEVQLNSKTELYLDKTLGMWWCPLTDHFQFKVNLERIPAAVVKKERRATKREVTSIVMSLFDPLGFLSPVKVKAMIIIQNIWKSGISWDDELTPQLDEQWNNWLQELEDVKSVKITRQLTTLEFDCIDMHVFVDASEVAYSSALYLRFTSGVKVEQVFVAGKARVAPLKGMTIPRMELEAALMGSRLAISVKKVFGGTMKIRSTTFWSDSKTVLCWLRSQSGRFKMYVQTRVGEILENSDVNEWKWVPTKQNVADDATRSKKSFEFNSDCRWLRGVTFLLESEGGWPKEDSSLLNGVKADDLEMKQDAFAAVEVMQFDLPTISRFSSWIRLIRATAAVFLALRKFKKIPPGYITVDDMRAAQVEWMKKVQMESFPDEMTAVEKGDSVKKTSRLRMLSLGCNNEGLLVLRGRIDAAADDNKVAKNPVILDPKHPYTQLWMQWLHEIGGHHGQERVISEIRKIAWVLDCRSAVRKCWATCQVCKLRKIQPQQPEMGQLPVCRLGMARQPFFHTGVDLFGPLQVKVNRSFQKRWGIIFTCMSSRAVYLDIVESLEAVEVINAITRFVSVRGPPHHIWSDNGTNFVKASKEIRAALAEWNQQDFQTSLTTKGIVWHFNPPAAPHMGGSWERLIGLAKRIMLSLLKNQAPRESILRTVLMQAADIMNSRPLTYASTDPDDAECITPNHLIKMSSVNGPIIPGIFEEKDRFRRMWKYTQHLADEFWRRWTSEYLPTLLRREKWTKTVEPLKVGDVVFLVDDLMPRSSWKKGIVVATFPGNDGQVRVVDVRVALGDMKKKKISFTVLRRPAVKVIPLGLCSIVTGGHWEGGNVLVASSEEEGTGGAEDEREK